MAFAFLGLIVYSVLEGRYSEKYLNSIFQTFLLVGLIFFFVTVGFLLIFWEAKKQRRQGEAQGRARGEGSMGSMEVRQRGIPYPKLPPLPGFPSYEDATAAQENGLRSCLHCGAAARPDASFCSRCGAKLPLA